MVKEMEDMEANAADDYGNPVTLSITGGTIQKKTDEKEYPAKMDVVFGERGGRLYGLRLRLDISPKDVADIMAKIDGDGMLRVKI